MESSGRTSVLARAGIVLMVAGLVILVVRLVTDDGPTAGPTVVVDGTAASPPATSADSVEVVPEGSSSTVASPEPPGVQPEGFTTITAQITGADGEVCEVCVWLADSSEERGRGLMDVTDLGDAAGMVFRFDEPVTNSFYMLNTPTPLSIAWFDPSGEFMASTDMEPCIDIPDDGCPLYRPGSEFQVALEVFEGGLTDLGVGPGARIDLFPGTEADACPAAS